MFPSEGAVDLILQVDRRDLGSFLSESSGADESRVRLKIPDAGARRPERIIDALALAISRHS